MDFVLLAATMLFSVGIALVVWAMAVYRKLYSTILKVFLVVFLVANFSLAQEDISTLIDEESEFLIDTNEEIFIPVDDHPIVLDPNTQLKANEIVNANINGWMEEMLVRMKFEVFLNDNLTLNLTNETGLFYA